MNDIAKIEAIYHAVLEKPPAEREFFLRESCGDDEHLRREVESLLSFDEKAADFIETPPGGLAADFIGGNGKNDDLIGQSFGHYRILAPVGAGGMGEVYLAEDTKLGRKAALKLLPAQFSENAERRMRFEQEARAASALNHPNIITIYGIEEFKEFIFIATEYIEGQTLRERFADGALSVSDSLKIAVQIASALEAAHSVGIIHRDIKPANIMIRRDGIVKILDFGLAKLTMVSSTDQEAETVKRLHTKSGMVLGTVAYMSPEQALGENLDARSDIFSFGVVLYEMLTGTSPFGGTSDAAIYNATLNEIPPLPRTINPQISLELESVISRMMAKKRTERYQNAEELQRDLQNLQSGSFENFSAGSSRKSNFIPQTGVSEKILFAAAAGILLVSAIIYFSFFAQQTGTNSPDVAKNFNFTQFTGGGDASFPNLSPDGKTVIFSSRAEGNWDIYFQRVGGENAINLTKDSPADDLQAVYSPDGSQIAFHSDREGGGIFLMGATGESVRRISDAGFHPSWSPDGKEIVFSTATFDQPGERYQHPAAILTVDVATGEKREINTGGDAIQPSWSPDGGRIAFWSLTKNRDIKTVSADGSGEPIAVTDDTALNWNPVWSPDGKYLYYASDRGGSMNFWRVPIDAKTGKKLGEPEPFTTPSSYSRHLAFSADGKIIAYVQTTNTANIARTEFDPRAETASKNVQTLTQGGGRFNRTPFASPDGELISFDAIKDKQEDVFVMRRDGTGVRQLTNDIYRDRAVNWSPDGKKLIFYTDRSGTYECWTINPDGTNLQQITFDGEPYGGICIYSPDGKQIVQSGFGVNPRIFSAEKPITEQTPFKMPAFYDGGDYIQATSWSPDGDKIGCWRASEIPGQMGVVYYSLRDRKYTVVADYGESPVWLSDSSRLIFFENNRIFLHNTATVKTKEIIKLPLNEGLQLLDVAPDDRSIYFALRKSESNIWLATLE